MTNNNTLSVMIDYWVLRNFVAGDMGSGGIQNALFYRGLGNL